MVRLRLTIIALCVFSTLNYAYGLSAQRPASTCILYYGQSEVTTLAKKIQSLDDSKKKDTDWLAFPKGDPQTQALVDQLIKLSTVQKEALLEQVLKNKSRHRDFRRIVLLALYDKTTWFEFIDRAMRGPLLDDSLVNSLIPLIRSMPENLKADVLAKVTPSYSKLSKVNFTKFPFRTNLRLAPKRSIDALILHIIKPDEWFKKDYEITNNALETYTRYLQFLKTDIFKNSDRGNYSTAEVITVAEAIQKVLQDNINKFTGQASITITGSFPNGRAKISDTDLDSRISHTEMHDLLDDMSSAVNKAMLIYPFPSKFTVEAMWATTTAHFAAQINPLFLRITPSEIQVEVYSAVRPLHKDSVLMEYNYEAPTRYTIKTNDFKHPKLALVSSLKRHDVRWLENKLHSGLENFSLNVRPSKKSTASASADEIVSTVLGLNPIAARDVHFQVNNSVSGFTASRDARQLIRLALYDTEAWEQFVHDATKRPQSNDALFNALVPVFAKMPENLQTKLSNLIAAAYSAASDKAWIRKGILFRKSYGLISPRDALDVITNQVFQAKKFIEVEIQKGHAPEFAYDRFLSRQHNQFYSQTPRIKPYGLKDIKSVAEKVQNAIKKDPELFGKNGIQIVGRFPNGRAEMDDLSLELIVGDPLNKKIVHALSYALNGKTKPSAKEFVEVDIKTIEPSTTKEAIVNPIQIKVTKDSIELQVHAPIQNLDRDRYHLPQNYPAPAVYTIPMANAFAELKDAS